MNKFRISKSVKVSPGEYFSAELSKHFDEHVKKSVPFYDEFLIKISNLSNFFIRNDCYVYDLGCSTGNLLKRIIDKNKNKKNINFVGIDNSKEMVKICKSNFKKYKDIKITNGDILQYNFKKSDLITSSLTTHFIKPNLRIKLFKKIFDALNEKGSFIMLEKVNFSNPIVQSMMNELYFDFKKEQKLTDSEILDKNRSLRGVLDPFDNNEHILNLKKTGFKKVELIMKVEFFELILAIK